MNMKLDLEKSNLHGTLKWESEVENLILLEAVFSWPCNELQKKYGMCFLIHCSSLQINVFGCKYLFG